MKWFELVINTVNEAVEPIANILHEAGASGVVIEDSAELIKERDSFYGEVYELKDDDYPTEGVNVKAYLQYDDEFDENVNKIASNIIHLESLNINIGKNELTINEVKEEDWAHSWKQFYHPVQVTNKITIVPTWEQYNKRYDDEIIIELDPGMAFGTGTHPTTQMSLQAIERIISPGQSVIDVGTGSGVLSIAAAKLGAERVRAVDLDEVAVSAARENVKINNVESIVSVSCNDLLDYVSDKVDIVVANILADVIIKLSGDAAAVTKQAGYFISSGIIVDKEAEVTNALEKASFQVVDKLVDGDWVTLIARKD